MPHGGQGEESRLRASSATSNMERRDFPGRNLLLFNVLSGTPVAGLPHDARRCTADPGKTPAGNRAFVEEQGERLTRSYALARASSCVGDHLKLGLIV